MKTYWHLAEQRRIPSTYDVVTSRLLYYPTKGIAIDTPVARWFERYQEGSPLQVANWERFRDPRETTYQSYVQLQNDQESFIDQLINASERAGEDAKLGADWLRFAEAVVPVLGFPCHGLHMLAAYNGQMAPEGKVVVAWAFQAADEIRRIQRLAYRTRQLQELRPTFGHGSKDVWQTDPRWQPLRKLVERLLVTYDLGEAWVGCNLVFKPMFDRLFMAQFARLARQRGDTLLSQMLLALYEDCQWQKAWTEALVRVVLDAADSNAALVTGWVCKWSPEALAAASSVMGAWPISDSERGELFDELMHEHMLWLSQLGIEATRAERSPESWQKCEEA